MMTHFYPDWSGLSPRMTKPLAVGHVGSLEWFDDYENDENQMRRPSLTRSQPTEPVWDILDWPSSKHQTWEHLGVPVLLVAFQRLAGRCQGTLKPFWQYSAISILFIFQ